LPEKLQKQKALLHAFARWIRTHHCREQSILPRSADLKMSLDTETLSKKLVCPIEAIGAPPISSCEFMSGASVAGMPQLVKGAVAQIQEFKKLIARKGLHRGLGGWSGARMTDRPFWKRKLGVLRFLGYGSANTVN
jgi:hypothetical protein